MEKILKDGKHYIYSARTGKTYIIEPIKPHENYGSNWGDQDPVSGKLTGNYGTKYNGAVTEENSIVTEENGYINITTIEGGSPYSEIEKIDSQYPTIDDKNTKI